MPRLDAELAEALRASEKDRAENVMIVDLLRNDLSKNCALGSVKVPKLFDVESFATVHHLVSTVTGELRPDRDALDLLRGCFPGGSITGAPKLRAMQIIEELEPHRRGVYCGAIGYIGFDGNMDLNIAIRTLVHSQRRDPFLGGRRHRCRLAARGRIPGNLRQGGGDVEAAAAEQRGWSGRSLTPRFNCVNGDKG